jgi:Bacterial mobilisation protein (MobC)
VARHKRSFTGERLTAGLHVKCTPSERRRLDAAAVKRGMSLSDYARRAVFRRPIEPARAAAAPHYPEAVALWEQVRALGVNMNQIAHHLNATGELDDVPALRALCREIKAVFARIMAL